MRHATTDDIGDLTALFEDVDALHRRQLPEIFQAPDGPAWGADYFTKLIVDENVALLVAEVEGKAVGFAHAFVKDAPDLPILVLRRYVVVDGISVSAAFQHHGIGKRLMEAVQRWAIAQGATSIELNVYHFNTDAIAFYERLGYKPLSQKMSKPLNYE